MRKEWCDHYNRDVTLEECVRCSFLCEYRPWLQEAGLQSTNMVIRWGRAEIERFRNSRTGLVY